MSDAVEYLWMIDTSGKLEDVIRYVKDFKLTSFKKLVRSSSDGAIVHVEIKVEPSEEDIADMERARTAILAELADVKMPFAGVCARYLSNARSLGAGYTMSIAIAAYSRME